MLTPFIQQPTVARLVRSNEVGGRFTNVGDAQIEYNRWNGEVVEVNDQVVTIPVTGWQLNVTDNMIDDSGLDEGSPAGATGLYYVYVSNNLATYLPESIALSQWPPSDSVTSGQPYLATSGNGANWRLLALVYLVDDGIGGWAFRDSETQRLICHIENQIPRSLRGRPGYVNDNAQTNVVVANAAFGKLSAATPAIGLVEFLGSYRNTSAVELELDVAVVAGTVGAVSQWGIGIDSLTDPVVAAQVAVAAVNVMATCSHVYEPLSGYHYAAPLAQTGAGATFAADTGRHGAAADVPATVLTGWVMA